MSLNLNKLHELAIFTAVIFENRPSNSETDFLFEFVAMKEYC